MIPYLETTPAEKLFMYRNYKVTNVLTRYALSIFKSPLFWCLAATLAIRFVAPWYVSISVLSAEVVVLGLFYKHFPDLLMHEISIADSYVRHSISRLFPGFKQTWWHKIEENLFLSAIPYKEIMKSFFLQNKIEAVLAILEEKEYRTTCFGTPILEEEWKNRQVNIFKVSCPDQTPLTLEQLDQAADFINLHIQKGILVHCKAGRGRSAMAILAYQIKYKKYTAQNAIHSLKAIRKVVNLSASQKSTLFKFESKPTL